VVVLTPWTTTAVPADSNDYCRITVVDNQTGRGVPMTRVELESRHSYYTDSKGIVAFHEPDIMDTDLHFSFRSHGYDLDLVAHPTGKYRDQTNWETTSIRLACATGGNLMLQMQRSDNQVAQRLYRLNGYGIYRDSALMGIAQPLAEPLLNTGVTTQSEAISTVHSGQVFWAWADTYGTALAHNQKVAVATSELYGSGGLNPETGVDLDYFDNTAGTFTKEMAAGMNGTVELTSLVSAEDTQSNAHLVAQHRREHNGTTYLGLMEFNPATETFVLLFEETEATADANPSVYGPSASVMELNVSGSDYFYYMKKHLSRSGNDYASVTNLGTYEAFTCLDPGEKMNGASTQVNRSGGNLVWSWQILTDPIGNQEMNELVSHGLMNDNERWIRPYDVLTGSSLNFNDSSVMYNAYRQRYCMIMQENGGVASDMGEWWYMESDTPMGPWTYARQIVTHAEYGFNHPCFHPYFSVNNGAKMLFSGTIDKADSGTRTALKGYDYTQIMYLLDLADKRLAVPVPVYALAAAPNDLKTGEHYTVNQTGRSLPFLAYDRHITETEAWIYSAGTERLTSSTNPADYPGANFFALPASSTNAPSTASLLYETNSGGNYSYSTQSGGTPICWVWKTKTNFNPYE
jgi:hypothetical protein